MKLIKTLGFVLGLSTLLFTSCTQELKDQIKQLEEENQELVEKNKDLTGITNLSNYKANNLVKVTVKDVKGYGTIWGNNAKEESSARSVAASRSALNVLGSETLVAFDKDGNAFEALTLPEGLADWCEFQPVREVYQCPYTTIENGAKGIYVVFSWYIDWWKDKEDNPVAPIGQIFYIRPDGTVFDILGADGNVHKTLITYLKENDDVDYVKFDENGNIYMLVEDRDNNNKPYIVRFNPLSNDVTKYSIDGTNLWIRNFEITPDGKNIFLNVMTEYTKTADDNWEGNNYVYAVKVNSSEKPVALYEPEANDKSWAISHFNYDVANSALYFYAHADKNKHVGSGLYICKKDADGAFTKDGVTNYFEPAGWMLGAETIEGFKKSDGTYDAEKFLKYIKSFYGRNANKVYLTLDFFKQYEKAEACEVADIKDNNGLEFDFAHKIGGWFGPYDDLYVTENLYDSNGKLKQPTYYEADVGDITVKDDEYSKHVKGEIKEDGDTKDPRKDSELKTGNVLTELKAADFLLNYPVTYKEWDATAKKYVLKKSTVWDRYFTGVITTWNMKGAHFNSAPLYLLFTTDSTGKWSKENAAFPGDYAMDLNKDNAKTYALSEWAAATGGIVLSNNNGVWLLQDGESVDSNPDAWEPDYSYIIQIASKAGKITMTQPDALKNVKGYPENHDWKDRQDDDPWYKAPFKSTSKGFALTGADKHSIYYYDVSDGTCKKVYDNKKLATIYAFTLSKDSIVFNGVTNGGGNRTGTVDLAKAKADASKAETVIDTNAKLQTITVVDIPEVEQKVDPIEEAE